MSNLSSVFLAFGASGAWDERFSLPLCPALNNPWIYCAYALRVMEARGITAGERLALLENVESYARLCTVKLGLLHRWPDGHGPVTSFDELLGMAYLSKQLAAEILHYLETTDGIYCDQPGGEEDESYDVSRFIFLKPYLKACAGYRVGLISQALWAGHVLLDALRFKAGSTEDAGGRLRIWLMLDPMAKYLISGVAGKIWIAVMNAKNCKLKDMLAIEPKEYQVFALNAPEEW